MAKSKKIGSLGCQISDSNPSGRAGFNPAKSLPNAAAQGGKSGNWYQFGTKRLAASEGENAGVGGREPAPLTPPNAGEVLSAELVNRTELPAETRGLLAVVALIALSVRSLLRASGSGPGGPQSPRQVARVQAGTIGSALDHAASFEAARGPDSDPSPVLPPLPVPPPLQPWTCPHRAANGKQGLCGPCRAGLAPTDPACVCSRRELFCPVHGAELLLSPLPFAPTDPAPQADDFCPSCEAPTDECQCDAGAESCICRQPDPCDGQAVDMSPDCPTHGAEVRAILGGVESVASVGPVDCAGHPGVGADGLDELGRPACAACLESRGCPAPDARPARAALTVQPRSGGVLRMERTARGDVDCEFFRGRNTVHLFLREDEAAALAAFLQGGPSK